MDNSKSIAGIVGPTLVVMVVSELKAWNPTLYVEQIVPLIYLSGTLLFVAGLAIVRIHNIWIKGWQSSITILGWFGIVVGLARMFYPQAYKQNFDNGILALTIELLLIALGLFLTIKAYAKKF